MRPGQSSFRHHPSRGGRNPASRSLRNSDCRTVAPRSRKKSHALAHDRPTVTAPPRPPSEQQPSPPTGTGPVIGRAPQILGAFNADHAHLSLSDLARRARLPVSTVHRMLGDLLLRPRRAVWPPARPAARPSRCARERSAGRAPRRSG
ncbi:helix-turn-helix domain-containing protein [Streptomyces sp. NPDC002666]